MNISRLMPNISKHLRKDREYIAPSTNSHEGYSVPELVLKYGSIWSKARSIPNLGHYMIGCLYQLKKSYRSLYRQPVLPKREISDGDFTDLVSLAKSLGAADIGFAKVDPSMIFSNSAILFGNAIVLDILMEHERIGTAPSKIAEKEIFRTYYVLNRAVNKIKEFLYSRGYNAQAGPALGGEVNYPLLAQKAGMGYIGKHGMLITPSFGPSIRLAVVYTDITNLPFNKTNEHSWIPDFCETCNRCVRKCPAGAIYKETIVYDDGSHQHIDYKKCSVPFSKDRGCTVCVKECVFFKGDYVKIRNGYLKK
jgi:epoxyqueuosine reductase